MMRLWHCLRRLRQEWGALWILTLVFLAGALNAAGFLAFGQTLSHMTGNLTKLGLSIAGLDTGVPVFLLLLLCFFLGATLSGYGFPRHSLGQWRRSGLVLMVCGAVLFLSERLRLPDLLRMAVLALVLGGQNGLALRYRGILTRTTHMTGHVTDCGAALGRMIYEKSWKGENLRLFLFHLFCLVFFLMGVVFTSATTGWLKRSTEMDHIQLAALCYLILGVFTLVYSIRQKSRQAVQP